MNLNFITENYMTLVVIACLVVGYCIKHITWLEKLSNQYIPTIMVLLGAVLGCIANQEISLETIVYGAVSGLASTGLHQAFKQLIHKEES